MAADDATARSSRRPGIVGRTYLERGEPVVVLVQWRTIEAPHGPRNVMIRRSDGSLVVRPFRGLRRVRPAPPPSALPPSAPTP